MHLVATSSISGVDLRLRRCTRGSRLRTTPGARIASGSASCLTRHIIAVAFAPHSRSTCGAMLTPVPCSAFSEPSYLSTISSVSPLHEAVVTLEVRRLGEVGRQQEVKVAGRRVAREPRQEAVLGEQRLQVLGGLGEARRRHADVLDDQRDAWRAERRHQPLHPLAHVPQHLDLIAIAREPRPVDELAGREELERPALGLVELGGLGGAELDQQRGRLGRQRLPALRRARHVVSGGDQRRGDHQLGRARAERDQVADRVRRGLEIGEEHERDRRVRAERDRLEHRLGDERERALGPDHQPPEDLQRLSASRNAHSR